METSEVVQTLFGVLHIVNLTVMLFCLRKQVSNGFQNTLTKLTNFLIGTVGGGVQLGPLGTAATNRPIVPAPGDYDDWQGKPK
jgi:hypothetical protein